MTGSPCDEDTITNSTGENAEAPTNVLSKTNNVSSAHSKRTVVAFNKFALKVLCPCAVISVVVTVSARRELSNPSAFLTEEPYATVCLGSVEDERASEQEVAVVHI